MALKNKSKFSISSFSAITLVVSYKSFTLSDKQSVKFYVIILCKILFNSLKLVPFLENKLLSS